MRVQPRWWIGVVITLVYMAIVSALWSMTGFDYDAVGDSATTLREGVVIPVGVGAVFLAVAATYLGWWGPSLRERTRIAPRWTLAVPVLMVVIAVSLVASIDYDAVSSSYLVMLGIGVALVGFSEELLVRGLALVGFRGQMSEGWAWFASSVLFSVLHGINLLFGQSTGATLQQMGGAFVIGSALYVTRMSTGMLALAMATHALWDFGAIGMDATDGSSTVAGVLTFPLYIAALVAVFVIVRAHRGTREPARSTV